MITVRDKKDELSILLRLIGFSNDIDTIQYASYAANGMEKGMIKSALDRFKEDVKEYLNYISHIYFNNINYSALTNCTALTKRNEIAYLDGEKVLLETEEMPFYAFIIDFEDRSLKIFNNKETMLNRYVYELAGINSKGEPEYSLKSAFDNGEFPREIRKVNRGFAILGVVEKRKSIFTPSNKYTFKEELPWFKKLYYKIIKKKPSSEFKSFEQIHFFFAQWKDCEDIPFDYGTEEDYEDEFDEAYDREYSESKHDNSYHGPTKFEPILKGFDDKLDETFREICQTGKGRITLEIIGCNEEKEEEK